MATAINMSGLYNVTSVTDLVVFANDSTNHLLGGFAIIAIMIIIVIALVRKNWSVLNALASASYVGLIFGFFLLSLGMIDIYTIAFIGVALGIVLIIRHFDKD